MKFARTERKAISTKLDDLVVRGQLEGSPSFPLLITPIASYVNLREWLAGNMDSVYAELEEAGAVLFRGFDIAGQDGFAKILSLISADHLLEYKYKSTPRAHVGGNIYTSTEYPASQEIPMHNEMSYTSAWPMKIVFYSETVAEEGGATPLAHSGEVYKMIPFEIREEFERKKVMYIRNYGDLDLKWQDVFQTADKSGVSAFCDNAGINYKWSGDYLKTWQICDAVCRHPKTNEMLWFNQAHLFHVAALEQEVRQSLLALVDEDELPRNACFGDGSRIDDEVIDMINDIYTKTSVVFPWETNDLLLLDNMKVAHGRKPYKGKRKVLVGMY